MINSGFAIECVFVFERTKIEQTRIENDYQCISISGNDEIQFKVVLFCNLPCTLTHKVDKYPECKMYPVHLYSFVLRCYLSSPFSAFVFCFTCIQISIISHTFDETTLVSNAVVRLFQCL